MLVKKVYSGNIVKDIKDIRQVTNSMLNQNEIVFIPKKLDQFHAFIDFYRDDLVVFGDCDADGFSAINVVRQYLPECNYNFAYRDDRGFTVENVKDTLQKFPNTKAILTVDCGVNSVQAVNYAHSIGVQVFITDHHNPGNILPQCNIINPKVDKAEFDGLCGAGVIYTCFSKIYGNNDIAMQYAAIGTIADVVPVLYDSRYIAKTGLYSIQDLGNEFITATGLKPINLDENFIAWTVAPLINSGSRMGNEEIAARAYVDKDPFAIEKLVNSNTKRKEIIGEVLLNNLAKARESKHCVSLVLSEDVPVGVAGLISAKLNSMYSKPAIVILKDGLNLSASMRGPLSGSFVNNVKETYEVASGGGHNEAAGLQVRTDPEHLENRYHRFFEEQEHSITKQPYQADIKIDLDHVNEIWDDMQTLKPFGHMFEEPTFMLENLRCESNGTTRSGYKKYILQQGYVSIVCYDFNDVIKDAEQINFAEVKINKYPYAQNISCIVERIE